MWREGAVQGLCVLTPVLIAVLFYNPDNKLYSGHVAMLSVASILCMGEGVLAALQAKGKQRPAKLQLHLLLQSAAAILALLGFGAIYYSRLLAGKVHFTSWHSWAGAATLLCMAAVAAGGLLLYYGLPRQWRKYTRPLIKLHNLGGRLVYVSAQLALLLALKVLEPSHRKHKGVTTYLLALGVLLPPLVLLTTAWSRVAPSTNGGRLSQSSTVTNKGPAVIENNL